MKRIRLITRRGRRVRSGGARAALLAVALLALALVSVAGRAIFAGTAPLVDENFFGWALAQEYSPLSAHSDSLLQAALSPAIRLTPRAIQPTATASGPDTKQTSASAAAPTPTQAPHRQETTTLAPAAEPASPAPSPEPTAADLDPDIHTVTIFPGSTDGYDYADGVYIKNGTKYDIDVSSYLESTPEFEQKPHILIVHTHACEAYYDEGGELYTPTDVERTEDTNFNVVRIGDELEEIMLARGYAVTHIRDIFDYPSYNGSYARTLEAIEAALAENRNISIVIDLHRDAIEGADGTTWRAVCETGGRLAAQSMFVVGTDEGGLKHPLWRRNLLLAVHLQKYFADRCPALMRPISLTPSRYNQHATTGSLILEVGTSGNTLDEAIYSIQLIAGMTCDFLDELCA